MLVQLAPAPQLTLFAAHSSLSASTHNNLYNYYCTTGTCLPTELHDN